MPKLEGVTARRMADEFVAELFKRYRAPHVRQIASWIGFVVYGIDKLRTAEWNIPRSRQLRFELGGRTLVAGFDHKVKPRGGITFREVKGARRGDVLAALSSLDEARDFYENPRVLLPQQLSH